MTKAHGAYIETELFESKAHKALTRAEMRIYFHFLLKRKFGKWTGKPKKGLGKVITNNGQITFTYAEAEKLGFPRPTFRRAIDKFVEVGLIDITRQGQGGIVEDGKITGEATLYAISERWRSYGSKEFMNQKRKKDQRTGRGWAVYHSKKKQMEKAGKNKTGYQG